MAHQPHTNIPHPHLSSSDSTPARRVRPAGKGYNVLSFDGGGYRGYASLLTLRNILRRLKPEQPGLDTPVFPYLYFDLICGTSTGGLIAILLAVLHLDIDTAIRVYATLGKTLFKRGFRGLRYLLQDEKHNSALLREAVINILESHGGGRTLMEDPSFDRGCKCFVTVAHRDQEKANVYLVRSYPTPDGVDSIPIGHRWTILDAAMATAAAPTYFRSRNIVVDEQPFIFEDAGCRGANNPSQRAWDELELPCFSHCRIGCFVSIGTGAKGRMATGSPTRPKRGTVRRMVNNVVGFDRRVKELAKGLVNQATDVEVVERSVQRAAQSANTPYHRFNADQLGDVPFASYKTIPRMQGIMFEYHQRNDAQLKECSRQIDHAATQANQTVDTEPRKGGWVDLFRGWLHL